MPGPSQSSSGGPDSGPDSGPGGVRRVLDAGFACDKDVVLSGGERDAEAQRLDGVAFRSADLRTELRRVDLFAADAHRRLQAGQQREGVAAIGRNVNHAFEERVFSANLDPHRFSRWTRRH